MKKFRWRLWLVGAVTLSAAPRDLAEYLLFQGANGGWPSGRRALT